MEAGGKSQEATKAEGKAPVAGAADEDLSMEEILQSIRRIIAEDDKDGKKTEVKANGAKAKEKDEDVPGSDVFELTDMIKDDGSVVNVKTEAAKAPADVLEKIDEALSPEKKAEPAAAKEEPKKEEPKAEAKPEPKPEVKAPEVKEEPKPAPAPKAAAAPVAEPPAPDTESLLSAQAASASMEALNKLKAADQYVAPAPAGNAPAFRDGTTVEDLVTEMLKPMMKAWLDANLPQLVERIVEREIRKLTK